jgi:hypothetical protein
MTMQPPELLSPDGLRCLRLRAFNLRGDPREPLQLARHNAHDRGLAQRAM